VLIHVIGPNIRYIPVIIYVIEAKHKEHNSDSSCNRSQTYNTQQR
jgi:hypothetical protein